MTHRGKDWPVVPIKRVMNGLYDGPHATPSPSDEGPIFLGIKNITDEGHLDLSEIRHISEEEYPEWTKRVTPKPGDIVFTYEATLNRYAVIPQGFRGCLGRRVALIRPDTAKVNTRFLFYYFFGPEWRRTIERHQLRGSTVDRVPLTDFPEFPIRLPPMSEQRTISQTLGAYDDLIKNNARRIEILEEMVQAIYREWFVNFRFPGHEDVEMVESELGRIPEDWEVRPFEDLADLVRDSIRPTKHPSEEFDYYSFGAFDDGRRPEVERGEQIKSNKYLVHGGCVLLSKLNPRIPRVWRPPIEGQRRPITSTEFLVLIAGDCSSRSHLFELCRSREFLERFKSLAGGTSTSHQRVKPDDLLQLPIVVPPPSLVREFTDFASAIHALVDNLRESRDVLGEIRNLLLPKLVSGEIDVSELDIDTSGLPAWQST